MGKLTINVRTSSLLRVAAIASLSLYMGIVGGVIGYYAVGPRLLVKQAQIDRALSLGGGDVLHLDQHRR